MSTSQDGIRFCDNKDRAFIARRMNDAFQGHLSDTVRQNEAAKKNEYYQKKGFTASSETADTIGQKLVLTSVRDFSWHNASIYSTGGADAAAMMIFPIRDHSDDPFRFIDDPQVVQLRQIEANLPDSLYVAFLAVNWKFRRQGIAMKVLDHAVTKSRAKIFGSLVTLVVNSGNETALRLYQNYSFKEISRVAMDRNGEKKMEGNGHTLDLHVIRPELKMVILLVVCQEQKKLAQSSREKRTS